MFFKNELLWIHGILKDIPANQGSGFNLKNLVTYKSVKKIINRINNLIIITTTTGIQTQTLPVSHQVHQLIPLQRTVNFTILKG